MSDVIYPQFARAASAPEHCQIAERAPSLWERRRLEMACEHTTASAADLAAALAAHGRGIMVHDPVVDGETLENLLRAAVAIVYLRGALDEDTDLHNAIAAWLAKNGSDDDD